MLFERVSVAINLLIFCGSLYFFNPLFLFCTTAFFCFYEIKQLSHKESTKEKNLNSESSQDLLLRESIIFDHDKFDTICPPPSPEDTSLSITEETSPLKRSSSDESFPKTSFICLEEEIKSMKFEFQEFKTEMRNFIEDTNKRTTETPTQSNGFYEWLIFQLSPLILLKEDTQRGRFMKGLIGLFIFVFSGLCGLYYLMWGRVSPLVILSYRNTRPPNYDETILNIAVIVYLSDILQYIGGRVLGCTKINGHPSPNKTVEGYLTSITYFLAFWFWSRYYSNPVNIFKLFTCVFGGFIGDYFVSSSKRLMGVKDTGDILRSHGGVIDRIDSLLGASIFYTAIFC